MELSTNKYVQFLSATSLKNLLGEHWTKIPLNEKMAIKDYLLNFLASKAFIVDKEVMKMMIVLLAKICKLSWFDNPELQTMVTEITQFFTVNL